MKIHRFIGNFNLEGNGLELTASPLMNQIKKVLRLKVGEKIILSDGRSNEALGKISQIDKNSIGIEFEKRYQNKNEPERKVSLYLAILKRENFELVVQKATEVGVSEITPIITERTIKTGLNLERLQKITHEAAEQAGRGIVPVIHEPVEFKVAVKNKNNGVLFHISEVLPLEMPCAGQRAECLFVGPEGGFTENEVALAQQHNFTIASLGPLTLRAETAAIIASYLAVHK